MRTTQDFDDATPSVPGLAGSHHGRAAATAADAGPGHPGDRRAAHGRPGRRTGTGGGASRWRRGDAWIRFATVAAVVAVAGIAAVVSYRHMRAVALLYGEDPVNAAVIPLSVDGLIVAASATLLADSRAGRGRSWLSYALLALASAASLAANVMHADPTLAARVIAAWPSAALIGAYELLMGQIRAAVTADSTPDATAPPESRTPATPAGDQASAAGPPSPQVAGTPVGWLPEAPEPTGTRPKVVPIRPGTKKDRLRTLLEAVPPADPRSAYALAKELAPAVGLHEGTARRYIRQLRPGPQPAPGHAA